LPKQPASVPDPPPEMAEIVPLPPTRPRSVPWAWLASAEISDGPVFRSIGKGGRISAAALTDRSVANIVKRSAAMLGLNPRVLSSHSLRAGFVTSALEHGADIFKVMYVTRHRRAEALRGYDRRAKAFGIRTGDHCLAV
jgi:integrase